MSYGIVVRRLDRRRFIREERKMIEIRNTGKWPVCDRIHSAEVTMVGRLVGSSTSLRTVSSF